MASPLLEMRGITKVFPGVVANERVDLTVYQGEVHALLGENGAGKSTLMSILTGLYRPDEGEIFIRGEKVRFLSPRDAIVAGIGMVHQHFRLVYPHTVTENIVLGLKNTGWFLNMPRLHTEVAAFSEKYGLKVDPNARVWQLSVGEQQRVEIIKLLYRGAEILILDEPTAVLTPQEVGELFSILKAMAGEGKAVIVITHKLNEVMQVADRITVLRNGRSVATMLKAETTKEELTKLMVGREIQPECNESSCAGSKVVLELDRVVALNDKGLPALQDFSLRIHSGEILGIAGVAGNGQRELAEVIAGLRRVESGIVKLEEQDITNCSPQTAIDLGISLIPEDRMGMGMVPNLSLVQNLVLKSYRHKEFSRNGFLNWGHVIDEANRIVEEFEVKTAGIHTPVKLMSGGNQQKVLLAREISKNPKLIIAGYPARGLDVGATKTVHSILLKQKEMGTAILLISEDLDEIFNLSDRIAVVFAGRVMGIVNTSDATYEEVGLMMLGERRLEVAN